MNGMRVRLATTVITVLMASAGTAQAGFSASDAFLPMAGRQAGVFPSDWYTTVWIHNPGAAAATARIYLLERNTANPAPPWVDVLVPPGDTEKVENAVESLFHVQVFGALRVTCATQRLVVTSRVYSRGAGSGEKSSVGQDFAGVPASFAIGAGERSQILGGHQTLPSADSEYRFNFGFVETTGHQVNVRVRAYDGNGDDKGFKDFNVREWSQRQVAFKDHFPAVSTENVRLEVEVLSGSGKVIAYGSGIANGSQDPTTFEMSYGDALLGIATVQHDATLVGDGTVAAPLGLADGAVSQGKLSATGGTAEQVLGTDGTSLQWQDDGLTLPFSGTATSDSPLFNVVNLGTSGAISTLSNGNYGVWGESTSVSGMGLYGVNKTSSGTTYGVFGDVYSPTGFSGYFQGGRFYVQGNAGFGTQDPSARLEVNGQVKITGGTPGAGKVLTSDAAGLGSWQAPGAGPWQENGSNVYYDSGNVGIGLNNPAGMLEIYGNSVDTYPTLLLSEADGYSRLSLRTMQASSKHWVLAGHTNPNNADSQFHLNYNNGSAGTNLFSAFGDSRISLNANVGIGTANPSARLEVAGQVKITGGSPGAGRVLTSDAAGLASWQAPASGPWLTDGSAVYYSLGNVAIGTSLARDRLNIYADNSSYLRFQNSSSGTTGTDGFVVGTDAAGSPAWVWNFENSNIHFGTNNTQRLTIAADGHIDTMGFLNLNSGGWGAALKVDEAQALWWDGTYFSWGYDGTYNYFADPVTIGNAASPGYMLYVQGTAYATGSWSSSDARFKKNVMPIDHALERIMDVEGASFEFRREEFQGYRFDQGTQFGLIAQDLEKVFPEIVKTEADGYKSVNYNGMIPVLLEAIKEQQREIDELRAAMAEMQHTQAGGEPR